MNNISVSSYLRTCQELSTELKTYEEAWANDTNAREEEKRVNEDEARYFAFLNKATYLQYGLGGLVHRFSTKEETRKFIEILELAHKLTRNLGGEKDLEDIKETIFTVYSFKRDVKLLQSMLDRISGIIEEHFCVDYTFLTFESIISLCQVELKMDKRVLRHLGNRPCIADLSWNSFEQHLMAAMVNQQWNLITAYSFCENHLHTFRTCASRYLLGLREKHYQDHPTREQPQITSFIESFKARFNITNVILEDLTALILKGDLEATKWAVEILTVDIHRVSGAMVLAAKSANLALVSYLHEQCKVVHNALVVDNRTYNPLSMAVKMGYHDIAQYFIHKGVPIVGVRVDLRNAKMLQLLIYEAGVLPDKSWMQEVIKNRDVDVFKLLLDTGFYSKQEIVKLVCQAGSIPLYNCLIEKCNTLPPTEMHQRMLIESVSSGSVEFMHFLVNGKHPHQAALHQTFTQASEELIDDFMLAAVTSNSTFMLRYICEVCFTPDPETLLILLDGAQCIEMQAYLMFLLCQDHTIKPLLNKIAFGGVNSVAAEQLEHIHVYLKERKFGP